MREQLLVTASALVPPPTSSLLEFSRKREQLAAAGSEKMACREDLERLVGAGNQQMAEDNNRNFARFMESLFADYDPLVLVETVLWVFRSYRSHGFQTTYWAANLNIWVDVMREALSEEAFEAIYPFYDWLVVNIPKFAKITDEAIEAAKVAVNDP